MPSLLRCFVVISREMKTALTIAGSDSSGGAGLQADLKTFTVLGVYGMSAVTAVTVQNTLGVKESVQTSPEFITQQIDAIAADIPADATKTGMIGSIEAIDAVTAAIKRNNLQPYVCDPVIVAKSGDVLTPPDSVDVMKKRLFPLAAIVTPNLREAAMLVGGNARSLNSVASCKDVARRIAGMGAKSVVVKGIETGGAFVDLYFDGREFIEFAGQIFPKEKTHGSGDAFSAAITAGLASGMNMVDAIDQAKQLVTMAIQYSDGQGRGTSPVNIVAFKPKKK